MKKKLQLLSLTIFLLASCQKEHEELSNAVRTQQLVASGDNCATEGLIEKVFNDCGVIRKYYIQLPVGFNPDSTYPLLMAFHGKGSGVKNKACAWKERIGAWIDENRFIAVYGRAYNDMTWFIDSTCLENVDEECYVQNIRNQMTTLYKIDTQHIYWMGTSNGGGLCIDLSRKIHWVSAITSIACYPWNELHMEDIPQLPLFQIHGALDGTINYDGVEFNCLDFVNADSACQQWAVHNGCLIAPLCSSAIIDGHVLNRSSWCGPKPALFAGCLRCILRKEVLHYRLEGIGHQVYEEIGIIPGYKERLNDDIFNFFKRH